MCGRRSHSGNVNVKRYSAPVSLVLRSIISTLPPYLCLNRQPALMFVCLCHLKNEQLPLIRAIVLDAAAVINRGLTCRGHPDGEDLPACFSERVLSVPMGRSFVGGGHPWGRGRGPQAVFRMFCDCVSEFCTQWVFLNPASELETARRHCLYVTLLWFELLSPTTVEQHLEVARHGNHFRQKGRKEKKTTSCMSRVQKVNNYWSEAKHPQGISIIIKKKVKKVTDWTSEGLGWAPTGACHWFVLCSGRVRCVLMGACLGAAPSREYIVPVKVCV